MTLLRTRIRRPHTRRYLVLAALLTLLSLPACAETLSGQARVLDGDTLAVAGQRVRLNGIDAPETRQACTRDGRRWPCGKAATQAMRRLIGGSKVTCDISGRDKYRRAIGACFAAGRDLQQQLVRQGLALAYRKYSSRYVPDEEAARAERVGLWSGEFTAPWRWRAERRRTPTRSFNRSRPAPAPNSRSSCRIKGNISDHGHIYHVPGGKHYDLTRINEARGERWFCTEADARAAGWRKARR